MWPIILVSIVAATAFAADEHCPAYPESQRRSDQLQVQKEQAAYAFAKSQPKHVALKLSASNNFIDDYLFGKMVTDGVESAPLASDAEIVRRLSLDMTGRLPSPEL